MYGCNRLFCSESNVIEHYTKVNRTYEYCNYYLNIQKSFSQLLVRLKHLNRLTATVKQYTFCEEQFRLK